MAQCLALDATIVATTYFNYIADRIASAQSKANFLAQSVDHHGIAGEIRELALIECIRPFLTHSFSCGTGKIIDTRQMVSDQVDLIVYHRKSVPPIFVNTELGLFPIESVRYAIEIKSKVTATELKDSLMKFRSISRLKSQTTDAAGNPISGNWNPTYVIFAFGSDISSSEIERYVQYDPEAPPICTVLCVLGKGYWAFSGIQNTWCGIDTTKEKVKYKEFAGFITGFMNSLASDEPLTYPFCPGLYVNVESA